MRFEAEVLRGVRLAAILFAVILVGLMVYRMVRITPVEPAGGGGGLAERQPPLPAAEATSKPPAKPSARPAGPDLPPPPPGSGASAPIHRAARKAPVASTDERPVIVGLSPDVFADAKIEHVAPEE